MGRLTARGNRGYASLKGTSCRYSHVSYDCQIEEGRSKLEEALEKLASYEDIIDEPEKLKLIDALYLERCQEINRLRAELAKLKLKTKNKIVDILAEEAYLQFSEFEVKHGYPTVNDCMDILENIVKKIVGI